MKWKWNVKENNILRIIIIAIALFFDFGFRFLPAPSGMSQDAFGVIGIFIGSLILWLTISIDWPSILCILALALLPNFGFTNAFTSSFGSETFVFLMFTFVCTYALSKTNLIKRITIWFMNTKLAKKSGWMFITMFLLSALVIGMFMSPTVLFVVLIPILEQIFEISGIQKGDKVGKLLYVGMAFAVSISSGMTPIAHVFPILALKTAGLTIDYLSYMAFAIPVGLIVFGLMLLMFRLLLKPDVSKLQNLDTTEIKNQLPPMDLREKLILSIFIFVLFLWIVPSICIDNLVFTIILFTISIFALALFGTELTINGRKKDNKSKLDFTFGILYITLSILIAGITLILQFTRTFSIIENLNNTGISFLILLSILLLLLMIYKLCKNIKLKKNYIKFIIFSVFLAIFTEFLIIFPNLATEALLFISNCKTAMPPIVGTILLCMIRVKNQPLITIQDAFKNGIPWSSLMMCAGTLTLGAALTNNSIGLKTWLETNLSSALGGMPQIILLIIFVVWALIQTNLSSNMVTATLVSAVANSLLLGISSTLVIPCVISIIGMLSAFAFATPPSMPHIAITTSSGYANTKDALKYGMILMLISAIISLLIGYPLGALLMK